MDLKSSEYHTINIEECLERCDLISNEPAILLLDEIQRYSSIDEDGKMKENNNYNDIWMLLSDGKFNNDISRKNKINELLLEELYCLYETEEEKDDKKKTAKQNYVYKSPYYSALRLKRLLKITDYSIQDLMKMNIDDKTILITNALNSKITNEGMSYDKLLIFISGNLDEAYQFSKNVEDTEIDADIYNELSKRITILDIKNALRAKFKPEQIARFGNNHIIYPCLDKKSYYGIIKKNCKLITDEIEIKHNIKIQISDNLYDVIYQNGVFPTQGVRPVISTINNIIGNNITYFIFHAITNNLNDFYLDYENSYLFVKMNDTIFKKEIILEIKNIKENKTIDEKILVMVHELGHALIYAILFNTPPKQINVNSSGFSEGFVINHTSVSNKTSMRNKISIYLAGLVAEEIVFGDEFKSAGASSDIAQATCIASQYIRNCGMDGFVSKLGRSEMATDFDTNYDIDKTNTIIETMLIEDKNRARDLINANIKTFKKLIKYTIEHNNIEIKDFLKICNDDNLNLIQKEINDKLIYSYENKVNLFLGQ
jgi:cell division protease FtsH